MVFFFLYLIITCRVDHTFCWLRENWTCLISLDTSMVFLPLPSRRMSQSDLFGPHNLVLTLITEIGVSSGTNPNPILLWDIAFHVSGYRIYSTQPQVIWQPCLVIVLEKEKRNKEKLWVASRRTPLSSRQYKQSLSRLSVTFFNSGSFDHQVWSFPSGDLQKGDLH